MARRQDMEWQRSERFTNRTLLYYVDELGNLKFTGYILRRANNKQYIVHFNHLELARFTHRTDARLYAELRAEIDREELTNS